MELKTIIEMSLIELMPTLPFLIYIIITQRRNFKRLLKVEKKVEDSAVASNRDTLRLEEIGTQIKDISATLLTHEFLLDKTSEGTLENMLFDDNPKRSNFQKLKAFRRLLAMKKNGRIWEKGTELILQNKRVIKDSDGNVIAKTDVWLDVMDTELGIPIVDKEYYEARLKEIRRRFYDDFSEK